MSRLVKVWTWDVGARDVDMDGDPLLVEQVLQTVLDGKPTRAKSTKRGREAASVPPSPELADWQVRSLEEVGRSSIGSEVVFGGGAALASVYLHHRFSEDLDFFLQREAVDADLAGITKALLKKGTSIDQRVLGPVRTLVRPLEV